MFVLAQNGAFVCALSVFVMAAAMLLVGAGLFLGVRLPFFFLGYFCTCVYADSSFHSLRAEGTGSVLARATQDGCAARKD